MSEKVTFVRVEQKDADIRLDRWFKRYYACVTHGQLEKMLRAKNIKVNGKKASSDLRLHPGDEIRVPPMTPTIPKEHAVCEQDAQFIRSCVIYKDDEVIVLNKPAGLAVQGGSKTVRHIDGMLNALKYDGERPRLVHRLDKDTSGVLILGRTAQATAFLAKTFQTKEARKVYWALVKGKPERDQGKITAPLLKRSGRDGGEMVFVDENGQKAQTLYRVVDTAGGKVSWLEMMPLTGRTHQLRVHCTVLGTPILGDAKYGKESARISEQDISPLMHLHARGLLIPHPKHGIIKIFADLPAHMKNSFDFFGFDVKKSKEPFEAFEKK